MSCHLDARLIEVALNGLCALNKLYPNSLVAHHALLGKGRREGERERERGRVTTQNMNITIWTGRLCLSTLSTIGAPMMVVVVVVVAAGEILNCGSVIYHLTSAGVCMNRTRQNGAMFEPSEEDECFTMALKCATNDKSRIGRSYRAATTKKAGDDSSRSRSSSSNNNNSHL